jgi:hypothetical protein
MQRINRAVLLFVVCVALIVALPLASAATIDVTATGSNDQTILNAAISSANTGDVLRLHGTFVLASTVTLKSGITLLGDGANYTTIYGGPSCGGASGSKTSGGWLELTGGSNVEISGITFTSSAKAIGDGGHGNSRNCILLTNCNNVRVHDLYFKRYLYNDGVRIRGGSNIYVYNCVAKSVGHDFVEILNGKNSMVWNCLIDVQTNCGIRLDDATNCTVAYVTAYADQGSGWCAFEIEDTMTKCVIDHCIARNMHGSTGNAAVQYVHGKGSLVVSNCVTWDVKSNVAGGKPTLVNNKFGATPQSESYWVSQGYGYGAANALTSFNLTEMEVETDTSSTTTTNSNDTNSNDTTITTTSIDDTPAMDGNLTELDLSSTLVDAIEPGTGKYQNVLSFSAATQNGVNTNNVSKSVFWFFPDTLMANLYGSGVMGYQPSSSLQFSPSAESTNSSSESNIIIPITSSTTIPTTTNSTTASTAAATTIVSPTNSTTVITTTTTTTTTTTILSGQVQNAINSLVMIQPKAYD